MSQVNVDSKHIEKLFFDLDDCITDVQKAIITINNGYRNLGAEWKDAKYKELGKIVDSCTKELVKVRDEFSEAFEKLRQLYEFILEYEGVDLSSGRMSFFERQAASRGFQSTSFFAASLGAQGAFAIASSLAHAPPGSIDTRAADPLLREIEERVAIHNAMRNFDASYIPTVSENPNNVLVVNTNQFNQPTVNESEE